MIKVSNLNKSYGEKQVLKNYCAEFGEGITCVMGVSGVGKTTLLHILAGLVKEDSGEISGLQSKRISMVFQENRLIESLSAVKNVSLVSDKPDINKIESLLAELGLEGSQHLPVSELSGGMKRRVTLARALIIDADVYLFDEPFKGLDEKLKASVIRVVKKHLENSVSIIVTHDPDEAKLLDAKLVLV